MSTQTYALASEHPAVSVLADLPTKWDANRKPLAFMLDQDDAAEVVAHLSRMGWIISRADEVELMPLVGPLFVEVAPGEFVNPNMVAQVREFNSSDDGPNSTLVSIAGAYITNVDGTAAEVVARLSGEGEGT